jgi:hypothetical protein
LISGMPRAPRCAVGGSRRDSKGLREVLANFPSMSRLGTNPAAGPLSPPFAAFLRPSASRPVSSTPSPSSRGSSSLAKPRGGQRRSAPLSSGSRSAAPPLAPPFPLHPFSGQCRQPSGHPWRGSSAAGSPTPTACARSTGAGATGVHGSWSGRAAARAPIAGRNGPT